MQYRQRRDTPQNETTRTARLLAAVRRPEYTGSNRCVPCTGVNLALAALLSSAVAILSAPVAVGVAGLSLASIWLRGYLVPGTPTLTKRYLPDRILAWFDTAHSPSAGFGVTPPDAEFGPDAESFDPAAFLLRAGVLTDDGADVRLTPAFETALAERALTITDLDAAAARMLDVEPSRVHTTQVGDAWRVLLDDRHAGNWESRAAFVADLAAYDLLSEATVWDDVPDDARGTVLTSVRACLETCPVCTGSITLDTTLVTSCCREHEVVAATCDDCGARLFEIRAAELTQ